MVKTGRFRSSQGHLNRPLAKILESPFDILDQERTQIPGDPVPDENSLHHKLLAICRQGIGRNLPAAVSQAVRQVI